METESHNLVSEAATIESGVLTMPLGRVFLIRIRRKWSPDLPPYFNLTTGQFFKFMFDVHFNLDMRFVLQLISIQKVYFLVKMFIVSIVVTHKDKNSNRKTTL